MIPLESALRSIDKFQLNYLELYLLHSQLILQFLHKLGFANSFERSLIDSNISKLISKYVIYSAKYSPDSESQADKQSSIDENEHDSLLSKKD